MISVCSGWQVLRFLGTGSGFRWIPTGFAVPRNRVPDTKVPGSEGCVPEGSKASVFDGFRRVRFCSLDGTGFRKPEVLRRFRVPTIPFPRFRKLLSTLKGHFCTLKAMIAYFLNWKYTIESIVVYFESIFLCSGSILLFLRVYFCTLKVCFCTLKVCFCTSKVCFCTLNV